MQCMYSSDSRGSGGHNGRGEGSFNRHGGRGGGRSSVQCQVCFKYNHRLLLVTIGSIHNIKLPIVEIMDSMEIVAIALTGLRIRIKN